MKCHKNQFISLKVYNRGVECYKKEEKYSLSKPLCGGLPGSTKILRKTFETKYSLNNRWNDYLNICENGITLLRIILNNILLNDSIDVKNETIYE